jgi:hypothetical protein
MEEEATNRRHCLAVEEDVQATIAKLKDVKLVNLKMLSEAWPAEYPVADSEDDTVEVETESDVSVLPSLVDITIGPAVAHSIENGDTADIEAMVWMPGKASPIKAALRQMSSFPDDGMGLLAKVIEKELETNKTQLDLSGFTLSSLQLKSLASSMEGI